MRNLSPRKVVLLIFILLLILAAFSFYKKIEWVEQEHELPPRAIAFKQRHLAAKRLLEQYQYTTATPNYRATLNALPENQHDVLWLAELNIDLPNNELDRLFLWVANGGHLVTSVRYVDHIDPIPNLVAKLEEYDITITPQSVANKLRETSPDGDNLYTLSTQIFNEENIDVQLGNGPYFHTNENELIKIGPTPKWHSLMSKTIGDGRLTLINNRFTFYNNRIGNVDNAFLLLKLMGQTNPESIAIIENTRYTPGLLATLWRKIPLVLISLGLVLIAWLIHASRRLGPIDVEYDHGRSNLLAHLAAKAQFWRKHKKLDTLLKPLRSAAFEKIRPLKGYEASPSIASDLSGAELDYAKTLGKCNEDELHTALFKEKLSDSEFNTGVSVLRNILNHSTIGPNRL